MAEESDKRKPEYNLSGLNKDTDARGRCGAGWLNEDGSISITLDPWVMLKGRGHGGNISLVLFPTRDDYVPRRNKPKSDTSRPYRKATPPDDLEDDIPF